MAVVNPEGLVSVSVQVGEGDTGVAQMVTQDGKLETAGLQSFCINLFQDKTDSSFGARRGRLATIG